MRLKIWKYQGPNSIVYKARLHDNHWQRWVVVKFASNPSVGEGIAVYLIFYFYFAYVSYL